MRYLGMFDTDSLISMPSNYQTWFVSSLNLRNNLCYKSLYLVLYIQFRQVFRQIFLALEMSLKVTRVLYLLIVQSVVLDINQNILKHIFRENFHKKMNLIVGSGRFFWFLTWAIFSVKTIVIVKT